MCGALNEESIDTGLLLIIVLNKAKRLLTAASTNSN